MFGTFRKHQTWLWAIIIGATVVSFVAYFSPDTKFKFRLFGNKPLYVEMNGHPVTIGGVPIPLDEEYQNVRKETLLSHFMRNGAWPGNEVSDQEDFKKDVVFRLFLLGKLKELDTANVAPMTQVLTDDQTADATLREDIHVGSTVAADVLKHAPDPEPPFFRVPKVIER